MALARARVSLAYALAILSSLLGYIVEDPDRETIQFVAIVSCSGFSFCIHIFVDYN